MEQQSILIHPLQIPEIRDFQNKIDFFLEKGEGNAETLRQQSVDVLNKWLAEGGSIVKVPLDYGSVGETTFEGEEYWVIHKMTNMPMDYITPYFHFNADIIVEQGLDSRTNRLHYRNILYPKASYSREKIERTALKLWKCPKCIEGYQFLESGSTEQVLNPTSETLKLSQSQKEVKESYSEETHMADNPQLKEIKKVIDEGKKQADGIDKQVADIFPMGAGTWFMNKAISVLVNSVINMGNGKLGQLLWKGIIGGGAIGLGALAKYQEKAGAGWDTTLTEYMKDGAVVGADILASAIESLASSQLSLSFEESEIVKEFNQFTRALKMDVGEGIKSLMSDTGRQIVSQIGFALGGFKPLPMLPGFPFADALQQVRQDVILRKDLVPSKDVDARRIHIKTEGPYGI